MKRCLLPDSLSAWVQVPQGGVKATADSVWPALAATGLDNSSTGSLTITVIAWQIPEDAHKRALISAFTVHAAPLYDVDQPDLSVTWLT